MKCISFKQNTWNPLTSTSCQYLKVDMSSICQNCHNAPDKRVCVGDWVCHYSCCWVSPLACPSFGSFYASIQLCFRWGYNGYSLLTNNRVRNVHNRQVKPCCLQTQASRRVRCHEGEKVARFFFFVGRFFKVFFNIYTAGGKQQNGALPPPSGLGCEFITVASVNRLLYAVYVLLKIIYILKYISLECIIYIQGK